MPKARIDHYYDRYAKRHGEELRLERLSKSQPEAWRVGQASAMIANMHLAGTPERADVWIAEEMAWSKRRDGVIERSLIPIAMIIEADEALQASFDRHVVLELGTALDNGFYS